MYNPPSDGQKAKSMWQYSFIIFIFIHDSPPNLSLLSFVLLCTLNVAHMQFFLLQNNKCLVLSHYIVALTKHLLLKII